MQVLQHLDCDVETLAAAFLYPFFIARLILIPTDPLILEMDRLLSPSLGKLLLGTQRMQAIDQISLVRAEQQQKLSDNLRKMLLAMVDDIRIVLIKLAERLVNLKKIRDQEQSVQMQAAHIAMDVYAPLANRLGIGYFKWQMEDGAFRYLNPNDYSTISKYLNMRREERESKIFEFIKCLKTLLQRFGVQPIEVLGRVKHIYGIYLKSQKKKSGCFSNL